MISRRRWPSLALWVAGVAAAFVPGVAAQDTPAPRLEISLRGDSADTQAVFPHVSTRELLTGGPWLSLLREGLPVRLGYRLELWKSRKAWFDELRQHVEWDVVVRWEPVLYEYSVRTITGSGMRERRYATAEALASALGATYRIAVRPVTEGTHYYVGILTVSTLSDSDIEELERFLHADADEGNDGALGNVIGRSVTRFLLRMAGLPSIRLEGRSRSFRE